MNKANTQTHRRLYINKKQKLIIQSSNHLIKATHGGAKVIIHNHPLKNMKNKAKEGG